MPQNEDIRAAVAEGILNPEQAERLNAFLDARRRGELADAADREEVRFARGFHDVFLTVGIVLLFVGLSITARAVGGILPLAAISAAVAWALAEFFARKRRLVLPSMVLSIIFVVHAGAVGMMLFGDRVISFNTLERPSFAVLFGAFVAFVAAGAFYLRFRLPFALGVVAAAAAAMFVSAIRFAAPEQVAASMPVLLLIAGVAVFAAAMTFDLSDPQRKTLRADNAFWLHLLAAPLILRAVFSLLDIERGNMSTDSAIVVIAIVLVFGLVAVVIDRRALLVAGLAYLGLALARLARTADLDTTSVAALTLVLLGAAVVLLGAGWQSVRATLLAILPLPAGLRIRLPAIPERT